MLDFKEIVKQIAPAVNTAVQAVKTAPVQTAQPSVAQQPPVQTQQPALVSSQPNTQMTNTASYTTMSETSTSASDIYTTAKQEDEKEAKKKFTREEEKASYETFINKKNEFGIKTTNINEEANEANFADYGAALSEDLKQEIVDSYDTEADYDLQATLAGLYTDKSVLNTDQFVAAAREMGYDVQLDYVGTTYISDNKFDGHYDTDVTNGAISVLTIKDPSTGAEIKIADANGNGAIESEELFMNEILQGISANIDTSQFGKAVAAGTSAGTINSETSEIVNVIGEEKYESIVNEYQDRYEEIEEEVEKAKENRKHQQEVKAKEEKEGIERISNKEYKKLIDSYVDEYLKENEKSDATDEEKEELMKEAVKYANKEASKKYRV